MCLIVKCSLVRRIRTSSSSRSISRIAMRLRRRDEGCVSIRSFTLPIVSSGLCLRSFATLRMPGVGTEGMGRHVRDEMMQASVDLVS